MCHGVFLSDDLQLRRHMLSLRQLLAVLLRPQPSDHVVERLLWPLTEQVCAHLLKQLLNLGLVGLQDEMTSVEPPRPSQVCQRARCPADLLRDHPTRRMAKQSARRPLAIQDIRTRWQHHTCHFTAILRPTSWYSISATGMHVAAPNHYLSLCPSAVSMSTIRRLRKLYGLASRYR